MATSTTFQELINKGQTKLTHGDLFGITSGTGTSAAAASNTINGILQFNSLGTTIASTLQDLPITPGGTSNRLLGWSGSSSRNHFHLVVRAYLIGTVDLTSIVGNRLTHSAGTLPMLRTRMGSASQPVTFDLLGLQVTTATATAAPVVTMNYTDQDGNATTGTKTLTFPSATTALNTLLFLQPEDTDSGVRDVTSVAQTAVTPTSGVCNLWGFEILDFNNNYASGQAFVRDSVRTAMACELIDPATPTSGSVTSVLTVMVIGTGGTTISNFSLTAVEDS